MRGRTSSNESFADAIWQSSSAATLCIASQMHSKYSNVQNAFCNLGKRELAAMAVSESKILHSYLVK